MTSASWIIFFLCLWTAKGVSEMATSDIESQTESLKPAGYLHTRSESLNLLPGLRECCWSQQACCWVSAATSSRNQPSLQLACCKWLCLWQTLPDMGFTDAQLSGYLIFDRKCFAVRKLVARKKKKKNEFLKVTWCDAGTCKCMTFALG